MQLRFLATKGWLPTTWARLSVFAFAKTSNQHKPLEYYNDEKEAKAGMGSNVRLRPGFHKKGVGKNAA